MNAMRLAIVAAAALAYGSTRAGDREGPKHGDGDGAITVSHLDSTAREGHPVRAVRIANGAAGGGADARGGEEKRREGASVQRDREFLQMIWTAP